MSTLEEIAAAADPALREYASPVEGAGYGDFVLDAVREGHDLHYGTPSIFQGMDDDLRLLAGAGIPTVQYGPGAIELAHAPDEYVPISEVVTASATLARLAAMSVQASCAPDEVRAGLLAEVDDWLSATPGSATMSP